MLDNEAYSTAFFEDMEVVFTSVDDRGRHLQSWDETEEQGFQKKLIEKEIEDDKAH